MHWDFLSLGDTFGSEKRLLVLKYDATHYCELVPYAMPTCVVVVVVEAILQWHAWFGAPPVWISD